MASHIGTKVKLHTRDGLYLGTLHNVDENKGRITLNWVVSIKSKTKLTGVQHFFQEEIIKVLNMENNEELKFEFDKIAERIKPLKSLKMKVIGFQGDEPVIGYRIPRRKRHLISLKTYWPNLSTISEEHTEEEVQPEANGDNYTYEHSLHGHVNGHINNRGCGCFITEHLSQVIPLSEMPKGKGRGQALIAAVRSLSMADTNAVHEGNRSTPESARDGQYSSTAVHSPDEGLKSASKELDNPTPDASTSSELKENISSCTENGSMIKNAAPERIGCGHALLIAAQSVPGVGIKSVAGSAKTEMKIPRGRAAFLLALRSQA